MKGKIKKPLLKDIYLIIIVATSTIFIIYYTKALLFNKSNTYDTINTLSTSTQNISTDHTKSNLVIHRSNLLPSTSLSASTLLSLPSIISSLPITNISISTSSSLIPHQSSLLLSMSWKEFLNKPIPKQSIPLKTIKKETAFNITYQPLLCSVEVNEKLLKPRLSLEDIQWCKWALDRNGGKVIVGKSWGTLKIKERVKFDSFNCNNVKYDSNPSCDDVWGDGFVHSWRKNINTRLSCDNTSNYQSKSNIKCYTNKDQSKYCIIEKLMIDFNKYKKIPNNKGTNLPPTKSFQRDFMKIDCKYEEQVLNDFTFPYLLSASTSSSSSSYISSNSNSYNNIKCDHILEGTVLLYSHDNIRNMGHTMNDIMNVWVMLWLDQKAHIIDTLPLLTIDALKLYNNFDDKINDFFTTYKKSFKSILQGSFYKDRTLCIDRVLFQPLPNKGFIWESWHADLPCSFIGPSSLYQRWNIHIRNYYKLLSTNKQSQNYNNNNNNKIINNKLTNINIKKKLKIVMIVRNENKNDWGNYRSSRLIINLLEVKGVLNSLSNLNNIDNSIENKIDNIEVIFQDLTKLTFEEQIFLISKTSILIGVHGAGIAHSLHMSIGEPNCCGVIEIYPEGEFTEARGHGNMIRKMGIHYDRIDINKLNSKSNGAIIPAKELKDIAIVMINKVIKQPACVLSNVMNNPYLLQ